MQEADGSFGESLKTYSDVSSKGQGASTPSQTAWGLIGLLAGANTSDPAITKAVSYLVRQPERRRLLERARFYRHRFPCVFYLKYHLYRNSFPVYAFSRYYNQARRDREFCALKFQPEEFRLRSGF